MAGTIDNPDKIFTHKITGELMDVFIKVHSKLGPGLLESVYEEVICFELKKRNILYARQVGIPVTYENIQLEVGFRADLIIENTVVVEIKSVESLAPVHHKQLLTYLKLTEKKAGLLVNFNVNLIKNGVVRIVNNF